MAHAIQMFDDRHACFFGNAFDQAFATARYHHINELVQSQHRAYGRTVSGFKQTHASFGQASFTQGLVDDFGDGLVAVKRFRASTE